MEAKNGASDDAKSSESSGNEFGEIVAGDVFDDFAAAAGECPVGQSEGDADDEVAKGAEAQAKRAAVAGGENAADGGLLRPERIESKALTMLGKRFLQSLNRAAGFHGNGEVGPGMLEDFAEARGG